MAQTPSPNYNDKALLAADSAFQNRVKQSMIAACVAIKNEGSGVAFHRERESYLVQVMNNPINFEPLFANAVANDANVIGDATVGGTVPLTSGNVTTQGALVTDAHIDAAVSSAFNSFFRTPAN